MANDLRQKFVDALMSRVGLPYRWGAAGPDAFDCSGLVYWGFLQVGLQIPRKSAAGLYEFFHGAKKLPSLARPGDLLLYGETASQIDHVMVCLRDWENGKSVLIGARGGDSSVKTFADAFFRNAKVDVVLSTYWRSRLQFCIDPWAASENQKRGGV